MPSSTTKPNAGDSRVIDLRDDRGHPGPTTSRPAAAPRTLTATRQRALLIGFDLLALLAFIAPFRTLGLVPVLLSMIVLLVVRWVRRLYMPRLSLSALDELPRALGCGLVAAGVVCALSPLPALGVSAIMGSLWALSAAVMLSLTRAPVYWLLKRLRRREVAAEPLLLVGSGVVAGAIVESAHGNRDYGVDLVAHVPDLLTTDLVAEARKTGTCSVLLAFSRASEAREVFELRKGLASGLKIMAVPRYFDLVGDQKADDVLFGMPVLRLGAGRPTVGLALKRALDVTLSLVCLVVLAPLLAIVGPLLRRETGGALFFRQIRIGKHGRQFELLKLQTMRPVARGASNTTWTVTPSSSRLGRLGRFLRKTSLDELPQLWNILRGDMSFVGPRPERPYFVEQFSQQYPHYEDRHRMTAGLTGLAQIYDLRGDTSIDHRARFDNRYADHWSLWVDVKIILKTVPKVFTGAGG